MRRSALAERKSIQHQLIEAQNRLHREVKAYEHLCESVPIGLLILDRHGRILEWNRRAAVILGAENPAGRPLSAFLDQDSADELHRIIHRDDWTELERTLNRSDAQPLLAAFKRRVLGNDSVLVMSLTD